MKKFINDPQDIVKELLEGFELAFPDHVRLVGERLVARATPKKQGSVGVVTLAGSGHEPAFSGYVGRGLLDISVPGGIFAAPGAPRCLDAIKRADTGAGVLFIVLNHEGDVLSSDVAMELAKRENINVRRLLTSEDISHAPRSEPENRRGLVGFMPVYKIAGAAAERGWSLDEVHSVGSIVAENMATLSVAVSPATHPATGEPMFVIGDDEMEVGMGQHGEAGHGRVALKSANDTADMMTSALVQDLELSSGEEVLVIVNGTGSTTLMEQLLIYRRVHQQLSESHINVARSLVGEYITVQEQGGFQLCLARMDEQSMDLWDDSCESPYFTRIGDRA